MIRILTNLNSEDIPPLPGLESEIISHPSMENKVIVLKYDEKAVLMEAFKLIKSLKKEIEQAKAVPMCRIIQMTDLKSAA